MDYNFKRIADVEEIESVSEDTMFLVNDGGVIKQTHAQMQSDGDGLSLNPILSNAKGTGGIGWTEQGEQNTIEWDGDTTGLVSVSLEEINLYKISDLIVPNSAIVGMSVALSDGRTASITQPLYERLVEMGTISDDISALGEGMAIFVRQNGASLFDIVFPETGVYVVKEEEGFISSLTYSTPDTIHKIDSKYIDKMIVTVEYSEDDDGYIADKTFKQIKDAVHSGTDIKCVLKSGNITVLTNLSSYYFDFDS